MDDEARWNAAVATSGGIVLGVSGTAVATAILKSMDTGAWLGFAGALIGGAMTVVAGWMAWSGAQEQVATAKKLAQKDEERAASLAAMYVGDTDRRAAAVSKILKNIDPDLFWTTNQTIISKYMSGTKPARLGVLQSDVDRHFDKIPLDLVVPIREVMNSHSAFDALLLNFSLGVSDPPGVTMPGDECFLLIDKHLKHLQNSTCGFHRRYDEWRYE